MADMLELCSEFPDVELAPGEVILTEGEKTGHLYVMSEGAIEVFRDDVTIALVTEPGSIFGEMSLLLDIPHTASVRAVGPAKVRVIDNAMEYLAAHPAMMVPIAQLLARRLQSSTTYLVDIKRQFQHHSDHFGMVDEVLESLTHQQDQGFMPDDDLPAEP
jgi:CRP/FNR family cyclic AMP-dependent transcriptional regulator